MLGTLLEKLGALLPRSFIIAAFFPVLLFAAGNGAMLYLMSETFRGWLRQYRALDAGQQALYGVPLLLAVAFAAYIFSTLNLSLRRLLEGEYLPRSLKAQLTAGQQARLDRLEEKIDGYRQQSFDLETHAEGWEAELANARERGKAQTAACAYSELSPAAGSVATLARRRARYRPVSDAEIANAVGQVRQELERCPVDTLSEADLDYRNKRLLDADHDTLLKLIDYARKHAENEFVASFNEREFSYSGYRVAPTAMGNVAESVRGYARSRYNINLDPFWLRLQKIVQDDTNFYVTLTDAKTQLDFLVALFWLTVTFTACWLGALVYLRRGLTLFLALGVAGPVLASLCYRLAVQNYLAFADALRTSLDLYRFKLLAALRIGQPENSSQERLAWGLLNEVIGYGEETEIRYKRGSD